MLSTTSQYALRALVQLARLPKDSTMLGRDIAAQAHIPANYLSKVLLALRNAGLVATARGSGGGYWLLRPAEAIHLKDVVELFEGVGIAGACILGHNKQCSAGDPCSAHEHWLDVRTAYEQFLENTTLVDISHVPPARPKATIMPFSAVPATVGH